MTAMGNAVEEFCRDPLFRTDPDQRRQREGAARRFTFSPGADPGEEAAPIVVDNTMYIVTPYPNHRLCARSDQTRRAMKWEYPPNPSPRRRASPAATSSIAAASISTARSSSTRWTAGPLRSTPKRTASLDQAAGRHQQRRKHHHGALCREGKVLVGNSGGEFGVRGWVQALDAAPARSSGRPMPRPRQGRADRPGFQALLDSDKGVDLGVKTWPPDAWKIGGGTMWGWMAYDPD